MTSGIRLYRHDEGVVFNGEKVSNDSWRERGRLPFDSGDFICLNEFMRVRKRMGEMVCNDDIVVLHVFSHSVSEVRRVDTSRSKIVLECDYT